MLGRGIARSLIHKRVGILASSLAPQQQQNTIIGYALHTSLMYHFAKLYWPTATALLSQPARPSFLRA